MKYAEFLEKINKQVPPRRTVSDGIHSILYNILEMVEGVDVPECEAVENGNMDRLDVAFTWSTTPQGHDYWRLVDNGSNPPHRDDLVFIKRLIEHHYENDYC